MIALQLFRVSDPTTEIQFHFLFGDFDLLSVLMINWAFHEDEVNRTLYS